MANPAFTIYLLRLEQGVICVDEFIRYTDAIPPKESVDKGYANALAEYRKIIETMFVKGGEVQTERVEEFIKYNPLQGWDIPRFTFDVRHKPTVYVKLGDQEFEAADVFDFCDLFAGGNQWSEIVVYATRLAQAFKEMGLVGQHTKGSYYPVEGFDQFHDDFRQEYRAFCRARRVS